MKKIMVLLSVLAFLGLAVGASADIISLVDFGMNGTYPSGSSNQMTTGQPSTWNNLAVNVSNAGSAPGTLLMADNGGSPDVSSYTLLDTTGTSTGWVISVARLTNTLGGIGTAGGGGNYSGTVAPDVAAFAPTTATQDSAYANNQSILGVTLTGLDNNKTYNLIAFTGRNTANSGANGLWALTTGTATTAQFQNAAGVYSANNQTTTRINSTGTNGGYAVEWLGVTPVGGTIAFKVDTANGNGGGNVTDLNLLSVAQIPEPATVGLLALTGFAAVLRRRMKIRK